MRRMLGHRDVRLWGACACTHLGERWRGRWSVSVDQAAGAGQSDWLEQCKLSRDQLCTHS